MTYLQPKIFKLHGMMAHLKWIDSVSLDPNMPHINIYKGIPIQHDDLLDLLVGKAMRKLSTSKRWDIHMNRDGTMVFSYHESNGGITHVYDLYSALAIEISETK